MSTFKFKNAVVDYRLLKNRFYPAKAALQLIGNHYRLSAFERNCLLRGVAGKAAATQRRKKILSVRFVRGRSLGIDWYNVLISVESYLKGACLFQADDGFVRDASRIHGSYRPSRVTDQAVELILSTLVALKPLHLDIFIDSPLSHSKKMRDALEHRLESQRGSCSFALFLLASADYRLKSYADIVATSDSVIIDHASGCIDLAAIVLRRNFAFRPQKIDRLDFHPGKQ